MNALRFFSALSILYAGMISPCSAQWSPLGGLFNVPVTNNCALTDGEVASSKADGIFFCPSRARTIDAQVTDASHFYLVQAYGMLAIHSGSKKLADCWAAHQLAQAPNGPHYVKQWIRHWKTYGLNNPAYGTPDQRIANVRSCCACGL